MATRIAAVCLVLVTLGAASAPGNTTLDTITGGALGNVLWRSILNNCLPKPSLTCLKTTIFSYLKQTVNHTEDLPITSFLTFTKNNLNSSTPDDEANLTDDLYVHPEPLEEMSRSLHHNTVNFLMNHDLELKLPDTIFEGSILKLSPRAFEGDGTLIKLEVLPPKDLIQQRSDVGEGRLFFKKIKKFISERLMYALMAILVVVKMIAAKFLFILPLAIGAAAAKKVLMKVLLFVFPALHHFFKWCAYVPHGTKYHHHKHLISHIHHVGGHAHGPPSHGHKVYGGPPHGHYEVIAPHADGPPSLHHFNDKEAPHQPLYHPEEEEFDYYHNGAAITNDLVHRQDATDTDNEVDSWGQGQQIRKEKLPMNRPLSSREIEKIVSKAEKEAQLKARLQQERNKIRLENLRLQDQLYKALKLQAKLKQEAKILAPATGLQPPEYPNFAKPPDEIIGPTKVIKFSSPPNYQNHQQIVDQIYKQPTFLTTQAPPQQQELSTTKTLSNYEKDILSAAAITYDPFYTPILDKIDGILNELGFLEEGCRERLICSMYKNPTKFSPHSNLISAELSRDAKELQKPQSTNAAVIRFYKYVQAARDGQDKRDCIRLYANCPVATE